MDLNAYKALKFKPLVLPSGFEIKVRSLSPYTILEIRNDLKKSEELSLDVYSLPVMDKLFKEFVVDPVMGEEMEVKDFLSEDYNEIVGMMFDQILLRESKRFKELKESDDAKDFSTQSEQSVKDSD